MLATLKSSLLYGCYRRHVTDSSRPVCLLRQAQKEKQDIDTGEPLEPSLKECVAAFVKLPALVSIQNINTFNRGIADLVGQDGIPKDTKREDVFHWHQWLGGVVPMNVA